MENGYSLSDLAAASGGNGSSAWVLIILFALIFGWGGNGFGGRTGEFGQFATSASQSEILLGQQFQTLGQSINQVGDGLCSSTYALNNSIMNEGRAVQTQISGMALDNQKNVDSVRYDMATMVAGINANIDAKFAALEKAQLQAQIDAQAAQINQLQMAQAMSGVIRYPNALTYNAGTSPFCNTCCN